MSCCVFRSHSSDGGGGGGGPSVFLHPPTASNGYAIEKSASSNSLHESADNMLKDLEGSLKASSNYIESHRSYSGPTGSHEYHEVRSYSSGGGGGAPGISSSSSRHQHHGGDFDLERQVQHMMPAGSVATTNGVPQLQSANMVSSQQKQMQQSYTTYKVQTNQYGSSGERIDHSQERPGSRLKQNIDELDTLLDDLNNARKMSSDAGGDYTASSITPGNMSSDDYSFHDSHLQDHVKKTVHSYNEYSYQTGGTGPSGKPPSPSPRRRAAGGPAQPLSSPSTVRKLSPGPSRRHQELSNNMMSSSSYSYSSNQQQQQQQQQREVTTSYPERPVQPSDGTPQGVSYYTKYHSTHTHQSQKSAPDGGPISFPTKDSGPRLGKTQATPKRVDDLMCELSEFDSSIQHTGFVEPVEAPPQHKYREPSPEPYRPPPREPSPARPVKQSSTPGPAVYYPPGDMYSKRKEETTVHPSGSDAGPVVVHRSLSEGGSSAAKARSKSKDRGGESDGKQGAAVVPICLPLCCAAPCVIM